MNQLWTSDNISIPSVYLTIMNINIDITVIGPAFWKEPGQWVLITLWESLTKSQTFILIPNHMTTSCNNYPHTSSAVNNGYR